MGKVQSVQNAGAAKQPAKKKMTAVSGKRMPTKRNANQMQCQPNAMPTKYYANQTQ